MALNWSHVWRGERVAGRALVSVVASIARGGFSLLASIIVARTLGPATFGDYVFISTSLLAFSTFVEFGTSHAFFTFTSQGRQSRTFFVTYAVLMLLQFAVPLLLIGVLVPDALLARLWAGEARSTLVLGLLASHMMYLVWGSVTYLGESVRRTALVQGASVVQAALHVSLLLLALAIGELSVQLVLGLLLIEYTLLSVALGPVLFRANLERERADEPLGEITGRYWTFCRPLIFYSVLGFVYAYADRWILQTYGGDVQQGYFGAAQQLASVGILAASAMTRVLGKEIAEAMKLGDLERAYGLYRQAARIGYFVAAAPIIALAPFLPDIVNVSYGGAFAAGLVSFYVMLFYPVHQALGQIQGTYFFAAEKTRIYTRLGTVFMLVSVPVTYMLLAPPRPWFPFGGMGSLGVALKLVGLQVIAINIQGWLIARAHHRRFEAAYQVITLVALGLTAFLAAGAARLVATFLHAGMVPTIAMHGIIYTALVGLILITRPSVFGTPHPRDILSAFTPRAQLAPQATKVP